ncbi:ribonuclease P protein component [Candidatus Nomurabacteria bacterium]|nr:ribonuclease P protein component [Candidatus Kaiserbacteria bacterium]MCB9814513.1 ribonuclease P protein component [Candidatus Nomurabacteria bacterium]
MFKKAERLTKKQFDNFFKTGKRFQFQHLTIIYSQHPSLHASVVVGKKVSKQAVRRNALRRRIYARLRSEVKAKDSIGVFIVIVKPTYNAIGRVAADEFLTASIAETIKNT